MSARSATTIAKRRSLNGDRSTRNRQRGGYGALNLVPFEAMLDARGRYLIERYAIGYLPSGRDLLRRQAARASRGAPAIVADPFFGKPASAAPHLTPHLTPRFAPLSGTAAEARQIQRIFPEATLLTQRGATKAALARLGGPRLLYIASHGFFVERAIRATPPIGSAESAGTRGMPRGVWTETENPLLRSGLALAGANAAAADATADAAGDDDGILTALEASSLNLWGTKLVTLSACDTGLGEVRNGEGVYGLRRAFLLAGAESMVMSLWPVSDYVTRKMMTAYYTSLRAGLGRGEALRRAKLAMIARGNDSGDGGGNGEVRPSPLRHPFFWASFIQPGEWAPLDGPP